jgi:hypothetical protein
LCADERQAFAGAADALPDLIAGTKLQPAGRPYFLVNVSNQ